MSLETKCPTCGKERGNSVTRGNSVGIGRRQRELMKLLRREGPQTCAEIVAALAQHPGSVHNRTQLLMKRQLIDRKPHPELAFKGYVYFLTDLGRKAINKRTPLYGAGRRQ